MASSNTRTSYVVRAIVLPHSFTIVDARGSHSPHYNYVMVSRDRPSDSLPGRCALRRRPWGRHRYQSGLSKRDTLPSRFPKRGAVGRPLARIVVSLTIVSRASSRCSATKGMPTPLAVEQMPWHLASPFNGMENGRVSPPQRRPAAPNLPTCHQPAANLPPTCRTKQSAWCGARSRRGIK